MSENPSSAQPHEDKNCLLTLSVKNFGPIADGKVDIRPLTVFLGRSNSGKTYLAKLIYAIHQTLSGYPQLPIAKNTDYYKQFLQLHDQLRNFISKKDKFQIGRQDIRNCIFDSFDLNATKTVEHLLKEILSCFRVNHISELCRVNARNGPLQIDVSYSVRKQRAWKIELGPKGSAILHYEKLEPDAIQFTERHYFDFVSKIQKLLAQSDGSETPSSAAKPDESFKALSNIYREMLRWLAYPDSKFPQNSFFLPANRGGILESFKFIADAWLAQIPKLGLEELPTTHALPKPSVDFIRGMLRSEPRFSPTENVRGIQDAADFLEKFVLGGSLRSAKQASATVPEFEYIPKNSKRAFKLNASSAMVSELTPFVVFLRAHVNPFDTIIVEEPEAHIHPGAMPQLARCLALLVRNNVRILVTTHSDWLLKSIRNLVLKGDILTQASPKANDEWYLLRSELGAWEFHQSKHASGIAVAPIPFDEIDGIEPKDIGMIDDALFNESAAYRNIRNARQRQ